MREWLSSVCGKLFFFFFDRILGLRGWRITRSGLRGQLDNQSQGGYSMTCCDSCGILGYLRQKVKRSTITSKPGEPLQFGDAEETGLPPSAELLSARLVADCIKAYRAAAKDVLDGKYSCYSEFVPQHLRTPCNTTV